MFVRVLLFIAVLTVAQSKKVSYELCEGNPGGKINYVDVEPCETDPCVFYDGSYMTLVNFEKRFPNNTEKIVTHGIKANVSVNFPMPKCQAEKHLECKSRQNDIRSLYLADMRDEEKPGECSPGYNTNKVNLKARWEVNDSEGNPMFCFILPFAIDKLTPQTTKPAAQTSTRGYESSSDPPSSLGSTPSSLGSTPSSLGSTPFAGSTDGPNMLYY